MPTGYPRLAWPASALPGLAWLVVFFLVPFYAILAVAMGSVDPVFATPRPAWSPLDWDTEAMGFVLDDLAHGGPFRTVLLRTLVYVAAALALSLVIAYPVAYTVARHGGRWKGLLLAGLVAPFFVSYLMRMLAWINLLQTDGWANEVLGRVGVGPVAWLDGRASSVVLGLVYGYVPFMILPLYAYLDRIDPRLLEAARDLGASSLQAFRLVTWPLSRSAVLAGCLIVALPMLGDYYTPDLLSGSPRTTMMGNQINLYVQGGQQVPVGAALVCVLMAILLVVLVVYAVATARLARRQGIA